MKKKLLIISLILSSIMCLIAMVIIPVNVYNKELAETVKSEYENNWQ